MVSRRTLNVPSLRELMRGIPFDRLPQPQLFSVRSRTVIIAKIPHGTGPEELLRELLSHVHPMGNIEKLSMSGNSTCYIRYELPIQAKRAVRQITRKLEYDLQLYHLAPIFVCLQSDEQKLQDYNVILRNERILESSKSLYVRNFGPSTSRIVLQNIFSAYGELARIPDIITRRGDVYAFVTYKNAGDRHSALLQAQGLKLPDGSVLFVTPYKAPTLNPAAVPAAVL